ncbi:MAG: Sua5/YciO/YrdC/YwlC family protein, partial [Chloroflexota bacterium]|nr:Sua5/YciO/YrdC/YwlC family protein [Chloroflexota bacterium]
VEQHCYVNAAERELLKSRQRPIVLLWRRPESNIAKAVAPNQKTLGVMLPYTPLHYLLFHDSKYSTLVMTSGNISEEPIATDNDAARERLGDLADAFLMHNRDIHVRCDDSVVRVVPKPSNGNQPAGIVQSPCSHPHPNHLPHLGPLSRPHPSSHPHPHPHPSPLPGGEGTASSPVGGGLRWGNERLQSTSLPITNSQPQTYQLRRSRGYVPYPISLSIETPPLLATGAELKNTFCLTKGRYAFLSHHIGNLENYETLRSFEDGIEHFERLFRIQPEVIACDMHPNYLATRYAVERSRCGHLPIYHVQHHHAHIAACMAEHGLTDDEAVIGVSFDGTGYGDDGAIWGGEFLLADYNGYHRCAHLAYTPLPGGDLAIKEPWRMALSWLHTAGIEWAHDLLPVQQASSAELD